MTLADEYERIGVFNRAEVDRHTAGWRDFAWRIIPETPLAPAVNVALDEVFAVPGAPPTVRFWRWNHPAIVLGRSQSLANEIEPAAAAAAGLHVVRRMSGGGAMFIEPAGAITYSMILPESALAGHTIRVSYELCDAWVVVALRELGIAVHHAPINDLACPAGKIGGASQARRNGLVVHHTTLAYAMDTAAMTRVLRIGRESVTPRGVRSAVKIVAPLDLQTTLPRDAVVAHLLRSFQLRYGGEVRPLDDTELLGGEDFARRKYETPEWTNDVG